MLQAAAHSGFAPVLEIYSVVVGAIAINGERRAVRLHRAYGNV